MEYQVNKGTVKCKGAYHKKGSFFNADEKDVKHLLKTGVVSPAQYQPQHFVEDPPPLNDDGKNDDQLPGEEMTVSELKEQIESINNVDYILDLLEQEKAKETPRSTAIKVIEERLKELGVDEL